MNVGIRTVVRPLVNDVTVMTILLLCFFPLAFFTFTDAGNDMTQGNSDQTYLYFYSSASETAAAVANKKHFSSAVPGNVYAASVNLRRQLEKVAEDVNAVEIGPLVSLFTDQPKVCQEVDGDNDAASSRTPNHVNSVSMATKSVSFDAARGRVMLHTRRRPEDHAFSVVSASVCPTEHLRACHENSTTHDDDGNPKIQKIFENADLHQTDTLSVSSFAMHDGILYFILEHQDRVDSINRQLSIELRRLRGFGQGEAPSADDSNEDPERRCAKLFSSTVTSQSYFDVSECSTLLAVVSRETFQRYPLHQALEGLLVVPFDKGLDFYLQVQHLRYDAFNRELSNVSIILYHFRLGQENKGTRHNVKTVQDTTYSDSKQTTPSMARPVHSTLFNSTEHMRYILYQRGGLSVLDLTLCWSVIDRVLCGRRSQNGFIDHVQTRLSPGMASTVCKGSDGLANVITGVALIDVTGSSVSFYFGCVAETPGMGGAGLFVIGGNDVNGTVYRLRVDGTDIKAESMFAVPSIVACPTVSRQMQQLAAASQQVTGRGGSRSMYMSAHLWQFPMYVLITLAALLHL